MRTKILLMALFACIGCASPKELVVEAEVLSINSHLLEGQLIGHFLGSSSGHISNNVIKVGVSFKIKDKLFLRDLKINHAELAYYGNRKKLPLEIEIYTYNITDYKLDIRLNGRFIQSIVLTGELGKKLIK